MIEGGRNSNGLKLSFVRRQKLSRVTWTEKWEESRQTVQSMDGGECGKPLNLLWGCQSWSGRVREGEIRVTAENWTGSVPFLAMDGILWTSPRCTNSYTAKTVWTLCHYVVS